MQNIITIDLEDWYQTQSYKAKIDKTDWDNIKGVLFANTVRILDLLRQFNVRATFFVLAYNAKRYPEIIRMIKEEGHEVGLHGYYHNLVCRQTPAQFRSEIEYSKRLLEDIGQTEIIGFRAPNWSIITSCLWALDILVELGFDYDSSIDGAVFKSMFNRIPLELLEVPRSVFTFLSISFPFAGGFFLRAYPYAFTKFLIDKMNKQGKEVMVYIHPWELSDESHNVQPKLYCIPIAKYGVDTTQQKLQFLLEDFKFNSIKGKYFTQYKDA